MEAGSDLSQTKEHAMATIRLHQTTTATPEQFLAGLTELLRTENTAAIPGQDVSQRDRCAVFASSATAREDGSGLTWRWRWR
jgi:hypothetical protein